MMSSNLERLLIQIAIDNQYILHALDILYDELGTQYFISAGLIRNCIWDYLHDRNNENPSSDIDVIHFSPSKTVLDDQNCEKHLKSVYPQFQWQIKNQALMHIFNQDRAYKNLTDAMCYWPEKETAIALQRYSKGRDIQNFRCVHSFPLDSLFDGCITHNKARDISLFHQRVEKKQWLRKWPKLRPVC